MNIYSVSMKGERDQNEDEYIVLLDEKKQYNFFAIFDGHGGKNISKYLFKNLPKYFTPEFIKKNLSDKYIYSVYDHLQQYLVEKYKNIATICGSTSLNVIYINKNDNKLLHIINSGDSRCVLCSNNIAIPLSKDHKPYWPEEKYRIEKKGGTIHFDGYDWRIKDLSVSRSFGDLHATPYVTHEPDIFKYKLNHLDKFIVIACDGVWDVLSNQDVINFVLTHCYDSTMTFRVDKNINIAKKLGNYALNSGSTDNITIIIVFFKLL
jgi:serine/threonine protein phosphatase PrpC